MQRAPAWSVCCMKDMPAPALHTGCGTWGQSLGICFMWCAGLVRGVGGRCTLHVMCRAGLGAWSNLWMSTVPLIQFTGPDEFLIPFERGHRCLPVNSLCVGISVNCFGSAPTAGPLMPFVLLPPPHLIGRGFKYVAIFTSTAISGKWPGQWGLSTSQGLGANGEIKC